MADVQETVQGATRGWKGEEPVLPCSLPTLTLNPQPPGLGESKCRGF